MTNTEPGMIARASGAVDRFFIKAASRLTTGVKNVTTMKTWQVVAIVGGIGLFVPVIVDMAISGVHPLMFILFPTMTAFYALFVAGHYHRRNLPVELRKEESDACLKSYPSVRTMCAVWIIGVTVYGLLRGDFGALGFGAVYIIYSDSIY
jgi:hypothetical protein